MAPDTAPEPAPTAAPESPAAPPPGRRGVWQLPAFAAGLAAAVAAVATFPPAPADPAERFRVEVNALRAVADLRPITPAGLAEVAALTPKIAADADRFPAVATAAHFAAGSGFVTLADHGPAADMAANWKAAADQFAKVDPAALTHPDDPKRLAYRQAKVSAALGRADAKALFPALSNPPVNEDDGGERPRLLGEVCLKLDPPDLKRARLELTTYLGGPPRLPAAELARLKMQLAGVHLRLSEPDKARGWLAGVGADAPADVLAVARVQQAELAGRDNDWAAAVKLLDAVLAQPGLPADQRAAVEYQAGVARLRVGDAAAAATHFDRAVAAPGPLAAAASVRLAELLLAEPAGKPGQATKAAGLLARVARDVPPDGLRNPHLSAGDLRAALEAAVARCLADADFVAAELAADGLEKVAPPGRAAELRAELNAAWAAAYQKQGNAAAAAARFKAAADAFVARAAAQKAASVRADLFRRAADCYRKANDPPSALKAIDAVTREAGLSADAAAGAWLEKGEILLAGHLYTEAEDALQRAMTAPGPTAAAARLKLAMAQVEQARAKLRAAADDAGRKAAQGQLDLARELLTQVANRPADQPAERDARQTALFELGKLLLGQGNIPDAEARFRQLIQDNPPAGPGATAKLYLGSCLLLLARGDHQGGKPPTDADRKLAEARTLFAELADAADPFLRAQADVRLANTTLLLKRYDDMPPLCDRLSQKYRGKTEELIVLSMLYTSYRFADRQADAARTLGRMEAVFAKLTDADFPGGADEYTRAYWQRQWFDALKATPMQ